MLRNILLSILLTATIIYMIVISIFVAFITGVIYLIAMVCEGFTCIWREERKYNQPIKRNEIVEEFERDKCLN